MAKKKNNGGNRRLKIWRKSAMAENAKESNRKVAKYSIVASFSESWR